MSCLHYILGLPWLSGANKVSALVELTFQWGDTGNYGTEMNKGLSEPISQYEIVVNAMPRIRIM